MALRPARAGAGVREVWGKPGVGSKGGRSEGGSGGVGVSHWRDSAQGKLRGGAQGGECAQEGVNPGLFEGISGPVGPTCEAQGLGPAEDEVNREPGCPMGGRGQEVRECKVKPGEGRKSVPGGPSAEGAPGEVARLGPRARAGLDEGPGTERDKPGLVLCPCGWEVGESRP